MRKIFYLIVAVFAVASSSASAHPLGNFSVNQYSRIAIEKSQIKVRAVLDMAEIPTFQESRTIDADKDGALSNAELDAYAEKITPDYVSNLFLSVDGQSIELRPSSVKISSPPGAGNLSTLRIEWDLAGDVPKPSAAISRVKYENKNYAERVGWNEIVVNRTAGVNVFDSTAFGSAVTDELKSYPQESLSAPLRERTAEFSFSSGAIPPNAARLQDRDGHASAPIEKDRFAELINREITLPVMLFGLLLAFAFGAAHALSPGHGKTVVGAYLVGSRGTIKHAVFLGLTVTITHTLGVFALGLITLFASEYVLPERLMPFLNFVSGLLVFFIGASLFKDRLFGALGWKTRAHHHHDEHAHDGHTHTHDGEHDHHHAHDGLTHTHGGSTHTHLPPKDISWKSLLALGISGGLLPCPSALVLMLSAISANRVGYGLILTLVFSFGLAATLTTIGLLFLYAGKTVGGSRFAGSRLVKILPVMSAFVIACVGAAICYNSLV